MKKSLYAIALDSCHLFHLLWQGEHPFRLYTPLENDPKSLRVGRATNTTGVWFLFWPLDTSIG